MNGDSAGPRGAFNILHDPTFHSIHRQVSRCVRLAPTLPRLLWGKRPSDVDVRTVRFERVSGATIGASLSQAKRFLVLAIREERDSRRYGLSSGGARRSLLTCRKWCSSSHGARWPVPTMPDRPLRRILECCWCDSHSTTANSGTSSPTASTRAADVLLARGDLTPTRPTRAGRFDLHELIREYLAQKLADSGESGPTRRLHFQ